MSGRISLLVAVIMTICGAGAIALAALAGHTALADYTWPANTMIWCWCWYGVNRTSRRLRGELDSALLIHRRGATGGMS